MVYDAVRLASDGSLNVLWDSERRGVQFLFNKVDPPVIDGGQIYVPNYNGGVDLYRLAELKKSRFIEENFYLEEVASSSSQS
jgi:hypothetical protein